MSSTLFVWRPNERIKSVSPTRVHIYYWHLAVFFSLAIFRYFGIAIKIDNADDDDTEKNVDIDNDVNNEAVRCATNRPEIGVHLR